MIYYLNGKIDNAIHYFTLAANQNYIEAQFYLSKIFFTGKFVQRDINKSIHFLTLASSLNHAKSQYILGNIYYFGHFGANKNINLAIYYFKKSAFQNNSDSQHILGLIYIRKNKQQSINEGINLLFKSSLNHNIHAYFSLGYIYHEGKYINYNISEAIHYYKEGSSMNDKYSKNNIGIIYKQLQKYTYSVDYFKEAIKLNSTISIYNLAHIYLYNLNNLDESINVLINLSIENFSPAIDLLCIVLVLKYGNDISYIKKELNNKFKNSFTMIGIIVQTLENKQFFNKIVFERIYFTYKEIDYLYNLFLEEIPSKELINAQKKQKSIKFNINFEFWEGFGNDIIL